MPKGEKELRKRRITWLLAKTMGASLSNLDRWNTHTCAGQVHNPIKLHEDIMNNHRVMKHTRTENNQRDLTQK